MLLKDPETEGEAEGAVRKEEDEDEEELMVVVAFIDLLVIEASLLSEEERWAAALFLLGDEEMSISGFCMLQREPEHFSFFLHCFLFVSSVVVVDDVVSCCLGCFLDLGVS